MSHTMKIDLLDGKYTYFFDNGAQWVYRNGEPWMSEDDCCGNNLLYAFACEVEELSGFLAKLEDVIGPIDLDELIESQED